MTSLVELRAAVRTWMLAGRQLEEVEEELINPAPVPDDVKAALWLFAWSFLEPEHQRAEAEAHMALLDRMGSD